MQADKRNSNPKLPSRVHGVNHADSGGSVPRPVWEFVFHTLGDYIRHVRKVDNKSNKSNVSDQSFEPCISVESHKCNRHLERNCNCSSGSCADDDCGDSSGNYTDPILRTTEPNKYGNFNCPVNNKLCSSSVCEGYCIESGSTGAEVGTDRRSAKAAKYYRNIESETGAT